MRKYIWGGTAVVMLGAVAVYLAADYAGRHPDSWLGRCAETAGYIGMRCNPFASLSGAATPLADKPCCRPDAEACAEPEDVECQPEAAPETVAPVADEASEPIQIELPRFGQDVEPAAPEAVPTGEETAEP